MWSEQEERSSQEKAERERRMVRRIRWAARSFLVGIPLAWIGVGLTINPVGTLLIVALLATFALMYWAAFYLFY